jgi:hypothetical protein
MNGYTLRAPRLRWQDDCARAPDDHESWDGDKGGAEVWVAKMGSLEPHQRSSMDSEGTSSTALAEVGRPDLATSVTGKRKLVQCSLPAPPVRSPLCYLSICPRTSPLGHMSEWTFT